jgi:hypothetical protein
LGNFQRYTGHSLGYGRIGGFRRPLPLNSLTRKTETSLKQTLAKEFATSQEPDIAPRELPPCGPPRAEAGVVIHTNKNATSTAAMVFFTVVSSFSLGHMLT